MWHLDHDEIMGKEGTSDAIEVCGKKDYEVK